jgi:rsbT antagonist protein RsbS
MSAASIVKFDQFLLVTVQTYMDDQAVLELTESLGNAVVRHAAIGVLIDISAVDVLDSFMARTLATMASASRLLGAETVVVGMRPEVALTLVELGMDVGDLRTALNVDAGTALLRRRPPGSR